MEPPQHLQGIGKHKPFELALRHAIAAADQHPNTRYSLIKIAERVLRLAAKGNIEAVKVIADRLDGKPQQAIDVTTRRVESLHEAQARDLASSFLEASKRAALRVSNGNVIDIKQPGRDADKPDVS